MFHHSKLVWLQIMWILFMSLLWKAGHEYIAAGDEDVFGKAGKEGFGIGCFFSSLQQRVISGLSFFAFSVIDVNERQSYSIQVSQIVKPAGEKTKKDHKKPVETVKRSKGRPKGSKNKKDGKPNLSPELLRIQPVLQALLAVLKDVLSISYLVMDGAASWPALCFQTTLGCGSVPTLQWQVPRTRAASQVWRQDRRTQDEKEILEK